MTHIVRDHVGWENRAACSGDAAPLFFTPTWSEAADVRAKREATAKSICACGVRSACLAYALRVGEPLGIWGGHTERELRELAAECR